VVTCGGAGETRTVQHHGRRVEPLASSLALSLALLLRKHAAVPAKLFAEVHQDVWRKSLRVGGLLFLDVGPL